MKLLLQATIEQTVKPCQEYFSVDLQQESRAATKKPREAVRFGLMFADIHYRFK